MVSLTEREFASSKTVIMFKEFSYRVLFLSSKCPVRIETNKDFGVSQPYS